MTEPSSEKPAITVLQQVALFRKQSSLLIPTPHYGFHTLTTILYCISRYFYSFHSPKHKQEHVILCNEQEVTPFGTVSKMLSVLEKELTRKVALQFHISAKVVMRWAHSLSILQNHCTYYNGIWARVFAKSIIFYKIYMTNFQYWSQKYSCSRSDFFLLTWLKSHIISKSYHLEQLTKMLTDFQNTIPYQFINDVVDSHIGLTRIQGVQEVLE
jgi:abortive infection bacteriophage resistance protein